MKKKRVILTWWEFDNRPETLKPFIDMSDEIEFIQLAYRFREERTGTSSPFEMIYWFDYKSPAKLLKECKPDLVLGTTEGLLHIALINECKKQNIPNYGLQHGITPDNLEELLPDFKRPTLISKNVLSKYVKIARFYFSTFLQGSVIRFLQAVKFFVLYYIQNPIKVLINNPYKWLRPDFYICFSEYSSKHYIETYRLLPNQIKYTGLIYFDELFKAKKKSESGDNYYLLIDTNFEEYKKSISKQQIDRCYGELVKYCNKNGATLRIKLHPWSYKYNDQFQDPGIQYYRDVDPYNLRELIVNARGCFGFYSTLTLPVATMEPLIQIKYDDVYMAVLEEQNIAPTLDFFIFTADDINFPVNEILHDAAKRKAIEYLIFSNDGKAVDRLKEILVN